jgi:hypothetical protein
MGGYGSVGILLLAGWAALTPWPVAWLYVAAVLSFEVWLARRIAAAGRRPAAVGQPPYHFTEEEARLIGRFRFYFAAPGLAQQCGSVLAAAGLTALVLAFWLLIRQAYVAAAVVGINLLVVARLTKIVAPLLTLRLAASRGDREALRMLELHGPLWAKIREGNSQEEMRERKMGA